MKSLIFLMSGVKGYVIGLTEIVLYLMVSNAIRQLLPSLQSVDLIMYYWFCFCVLTGFWEAVYVTNYDQVVAVAENLVKTKESVWTNKYPLIYILPNLLSRIFYAEYGAAADHEYMSKRKGDYWSRLIESSHAFLCATFALTSLLLVCNDEPVKATYVGIAGMGCQLMNSILYMGEYFLQCRDPSSPNYNCPKFPLGKWMSKRWFMWVNAPWLLFPSVIILTTLLK